jgi:predicted PurR-regulated permease PerM
MRNSDSNTDNVKLCSSGSLQGENFGEALGYAAANLFGIGPVIEKAYPTPLDKLKEQISNVNSNINDIIQQDSLKFDQIQNKIDEILLADIKATYNTMLAQNNFTKETLQDEISTNQIYIAASFIFIIIVFSYLLWFTKD